VGISSGRVERTWHPSIVWGQALPGNGDSGGLALPNFDQAIGGREGDLGQPLTRVGTTLRRRGGSCCAVGRPPFPEALASFGRRRWRCGAGTIVGQRLRGGRPSSGSAIAMMFIQAFDRYLETEKKPSSRCSRGRRLRQLPRLGVFPDANRGFTEGG